MSQVETEGPIYCTGAVKDLDEGLIYAKIKQNAVINTESFHIYRCRHDYG